MLVREGCRGCLLSLAGVWRIALYRNGSHLKTETNISAWCIDAPVPPSASVHLPYLSALYPLSFPYSISENKGVETNLKGQHQVVLDHRSIKWNTCPFPGRQNQCPEAMRKVPRFALPRRVLYWSNIWETFSENPEMGRIMNVCQRDWKGSFIVRWFLAEVPREQIESCGFDTPHRGCYPVSAQITYLT